MIIRPSKGSSSSKVVVGVVVAVVVVGLVVGVVVVSLVVGVEVVVAVVVGVVVSVVVAVVGVVENVIGSNPIDSSVVEYDQDVLIASPSGHGSRGGAGSKHSASVSSQLQIVCPSPKNVSCTLNNGEHSVVPGLSGSQYAASTHRVNSSPVSDVYASQQGKSSVATKQWDSPLLLTSLPS